jgi:Tfp pilus assembly protein PilF
MSCFNLRGGYVVLLLGFLFQGAIVVAQTVDEGTAFLQKGKFEEAKVVFENIIKNDKKDAKAHYGLGQLYLSRAYAGRDVEEAVDQLEAAADLDQNNADYQFLYGAALGEKTQRAGVFKQALLAPKVKKAFARAVELNPKHVQARIGLAQYLLRAPSIMGGDESEGWKQLDEAIKIDELQGRFVKASFLARAKRTDEAEKEYKILVAARPSEWRVWKSYGYFCLQNQRTDNAVKYFQKYIELRPDTADSYQSLAEAFLKKGETEQAMASLQKSLSLDKEFVPAIISLGEVYQAKGQKKEAKEAYQRAVTIAQNDYWKKQAETKLKEVE